MSRDGHTRLMNEIPKARMHPLLVALEYFGLSVLIALPVVYMQWQNTTRIDSTLTYRCEDQNDARKIGNERAQVLKDLINTAANTRSLEASTSTTRTQRMQNEAAAKAYRDLSKRVEMVPPLDCKKES